MADIAGTDQYDAALPTLERAVAALVSIQHRVTDRVDELLALGLADWRWPALRGRIDDVVDSPSTRARSRGAARRSTG